MENNCKYYHKSMPIIAGMIHILYDLEGCKCGGLCHIVVDEDNVDDESLDAVINICNQEEYKDRIDKDLSRYICEQLKLLSIEQRNLLFNYLNIGFDDCLDNMICVYNSDHDTACQDHCNKLAMTKKIIKEY